MIGEWAKGDDVVQPEDKWYIIKLLGKEIIPTDTKSYDLDIYNIQFAILVE